MTLYGRIIDGVLVKVNGLPFSERRLSTNEVIVDLAGEGAIWQRDCGWFDLSTVNPSELTSDPVQRDELAAAVASALAAESGRSSILDRMRALNDLARDVNWDWLDHNCHPSVAQMAFVVAQSPNAGGNWGSLTTLDKAEQLRLGVSYALVELIRITQLNGMLMDLLERMIERDPTLDIPADR